MKKTLTAIMITLSVSGCVGTDAYRPTQTLSIRIEGEGSNVYTLELIEGDHSKPFTQVNGVHTVPLSGKIYGKGIVFFVPVSHDPEKFETILVKENDVEVTRRTVKCVRKSIPAHDGVYSIHIENIK